MAELGLKTRRVSEGHALDFCALLNYVTGQLCVPMPMGDRGSFHSGSKLEQSSGTWQSRLYCENPNAVSPTARPQVSGHRVLLSLAGVHFTGFLIVPLDSHPFSVSGLARLCKPASAMGGL